MMSAPYVATFAGAYPPPDGYDFGQNGCNGQNGFEYSGKQYVVLEDGSNNKVGPYGYHIFENMAELDAPNAPAGSGPGGGIGGLQSWTVARDGTTVFLIETYSTGVTGAEGVEAAINVFTFDLVSKTWTSGPTPYAIPVRSQYRGGTILFSAGQAQWCVKLAVRGPNDYILMFSGHLDTTGGRYYSRLYYATFDGSIFGTPVMLPVQVGGGPYNLGIGPYYLGAGTVSVDSAGRCYFWAIDNSNNSTLGPSLILWTLTATNTLSAAQVVDIGVYWTDVQGTISNSIVFTPSGGSETVAIAAEICDDPTFTVIKQKLYTAPIGDTPTFTSSDVVSGADTWSNSSFAYGSNDDLQIPQFSEWNTNTIAIAHDAVANQLMVVWAVTRLDNTITPGNTQGHFWARTSPDNSLSWSSSILLFGSPPDLHDSSNAANNSAASQIFAYSTATGIGIIGISENESAQFYLIGCPASAASSGCSYFAH